MTVIREFSDKRASELVAGFFKGAGYWIREHGRIHTSVILRSDIMELESELEAYRQAAERLRDRGYRARYHQRVTLETGSFRYYQVGISIEF